MAQKALGLLATPDLQLWDLEQEHPDQMANYCFESEIKNDELVFDYKLRKGVCKSKSATFLLEQNKIIWVQSLFFYPWSDKYLLN